MARKTDTDLIGKRFGRWTALARSEVLKNNASQWFCRCDCGTEGLVMRSGLLRGTSQSCGCLHNELTSIRKREHGLSQNRLFPIWDSMMGRCYRPHNRAFSRYGGRGITVCQRWHDVRNFIADNEHLALPGLTLDRRDNDGSYTPENTRWVTRYVQSINRRSNVNITYGGRTQTLFEWAREVGIKPRTLWARIQKQGWSVAKALTTPVS